MALRIHRVKTDWVRPGNGSRILEAAGGKLPEMHYQAPVRSKRISGKLDVAAFLRGDEKPCYRMEADEGSMRGGVDIFFQAALLGCEDQADVDRRALASLSYAINLINEGIPVTLYACWVSRATVTSDIALGWVEITDTGLDMLAGIINKTTFRDYKNGVMMQRVHAFGSGPFGCDGGEARTVRDAKDFRNILKEGGVLTDNGVVLDWDSDNLPITD